MNFAERFNIILTTFISLCVLFICSCGSSDGKDKAINDQASIAPSVCDLTGTWEVNITEYSDYGTNNYSTSYEIFQNGSDIVISILYDGQQYTGTLSANRLTFSGVRMDNQGQNRINATATISDDGNSFTGTADWSDASQTQGKRKHEELEAIRISRHASSAAGIWDGQILQDTGDEIDFTADISQDGTILSGKLNLPSIGLENDDLTGTIDGFGIEFGDVNGRVLFVGTIHPPDNHESGHPRKSASGVLRCDAWQGEVEWRAAKKTVRPEANFQWQRMDMGITSELQKKITIGPGRNDAVRRVYTADSHEGTIHELSYINGRWEGIIFGEYAAKSGSSSTLHGIRDMVIGDGKDDGIQRIYVASNNFVEFEDAGHLFQGLQIVYSPEGQRQNGRHWNGADGIVIAAARNDGRHRVYIAAPVGIIELTATGEDWSREDVFTAEETSAEEENKVQKIIAADGRNDGGLRLYTLENHHDIYEYTWNNGQWNYELCMSTDKEIYDISAGDGRNDGIYRLYIAAGDDGIYEMTRNGTQWRIDQITTANPVEILEIGPGRNDGRQYVYAGDGDGLSEYLYSDHWQLASLIEGNLEIIDIAVGDGRNTGTAGVYITAGDNHLYEFMAPTP